jgi:hypothetical protein
MEFTIDGQSTGRILPQPVPNISADEQREFEQMASESNNLPRVNETWRDVNSTAMVMIIETGMASNGDFYVKIKEGNVVTTVSARTFYGRYTQEPSNPLKVGDEFLDASNKVVQIVSISSGGITIRGENGQTTRTSEAALRLNCRRFERKSVYDLIGGDDERF